MAVADVCDNLEFSLAECGCNAKLIAAAPDMLNLLKAFLNTGYYGTDVGKKAIDLINSIEAS